MLRVYAIFNFIFFCISKRILGSKIRALSINDNSSPLPETYVSVSPFIQCKTDREAGENERVGRKVSGSLKNRNTA